MEQYLHENDRWIWLLECSCSCLANPDCVEKDFLHSEQWYGLLLMLFLLLLLLLLLLWNSSSGLIWFCREFITSLVTFADLGLNLDQNVEDLS